MHVWIILLIAGALLGATGYWWRQQKVPVRMILMLSGVALLCLAWWQYDVWDSRNRDKRTVFSADAVAEFGAGFRGSEFGDAEPPGDDLEFSSSLVNADDAAQGNLGDQEFADSNPFASEADTNPFEPQSGEPTASPTPDAATLDPFAQSSYMDDPFAPTAATTNTESGRASSPRPAASRAEPTPETVDPFAQSTYMDDGATASVPAAKPRASKSPASPVTRPPALARSAPVEQPAKERVEKPAPAKRVAPLRAKPRKPAPPTDELAYLDERPVELPRWRSSQEIINQAAMPQADYARPELMSPMNDACRLDRSIDADGLCVVIRNALGHGQIDETLKIFIEGRPVGYLQVGAHKQQAMLPIRFTQAGRFGYRVVGTVRYANQLVPVDSHGVLVARDNYVYDVRLVPGENRIFLELEERFY